jgi:Putative Actinobacterial Holin-X, holin superfamily III
MNDLGDRERDEIGNRPLQDAKLPNLVTRMLDDMVRVAEAQAKLFEVNIGDALTSALDRAIGRAAAVVMYLTGGFCLIAAMIVLLRRWLLWWQALAIVGVVVLVAGWLVQMATARLSTKQVNESELE